MRNLLSKAMTASMVAGAALLVSACGGSEPAADNTTLTEMNSTDTMMDSTSNDMMAIDAAGMDSNMAMDNMSNAM
ncbi:hypothetical protein [Sphingomonas sp. ID0503]|uniref:hypothetical protein n=1 Tax=Sphingomonas sp. ID0503 TaxID=3399691 RepID=UPI003AFA29AD